MPDNGTISQFRNIHQEDIVVPSSSLKDAFSTDEDTVFSKIMQLGEHGEGQTEHYALARVIHAVADQDPAFQKLLKQLVNNLSPKDKKLAKRRYEEDFKGYSGTNFESFDNFLNNFWAEGIVQHLLQGPGGTSEIDQIKASNPDAVPTLDAIEQLFKGDPGTEGRIRGSENFQRKPTPPLSLGTGSGHFTAQPLLQDLPHGGKQTHKSYGFELELDNQEVLNNMATVLGLSPNYIDALRGNFGRSKFDLTTNGNQLVKSRNRNWGGGATVYPLENVFLSGDYNQWGKENDPTKAYQVGVGYSGGDNGITAGLRGGQTFHADQFNKTGKPETNISAEATVPLNLIPILGRILGYSP
jgi:hypothetical protein